MLLCVCYCVYNSYLISSEKQGNFKEAVLDIAPANTVTEHFLDGRIVDFKTHPEEDRSCNKI